MGASERTRVMTLDGSIVVMVSSLAFKFDQAPVTGELSIAYTSALFADARKTAPWAIMEQSGNPAFHGPGSGAWSSIHRVAVYTSMDPSGFQTETPEWRFRLRFSEQYDGLLPKRVAEMAEEAYQVYVRHQIESDE